MHERMHERALSCMHGTPRSPPARATGGRRWIHRRSDARTQDRNQLRRLRSTTSRAAAAPRARPRRLTPPARGRRAPSRGGAEPAVHLAAARPPVINDSPAQYHAWLWTQLWSAHRRASACCQRHATSSLCQPPRGSRGRGRKRQRAPGFPTSTFYAQRIAPLYLVVTRNITGIEGAILAFGIATSLSPL